MAKLDRKTARVFGGSAAAAPGGISKFGSLAGGTPDYSLDPEVVQELANWLQGWGAAVIGSNSPALEDMNAVHYVMAYQIAYILQQGVAEYDAETTYYLNSICSSGSGLFISLTNNNTGNTPTSSPTNWANLGGTTFQGNVDSGVADAYVITLTGFSSIRNGVIVAFTPSNTNTGSSTLTINAGAPVTLKDANGNNLLAGMLLAGQNYTFIANGTVLRLLNVAPSTTLSPTALTTDQNDYSPTGWDSSIGLLRISASVPVLISGLTPKRMTAPVTIKAITGPLYLTDSDVLSAAANRFSLPEGKPLVLWAGESITLQYDAVNSVWVTVGVSKTDWSTTNKGRKWFCNFDSDIRPAGISMQDLQHGGVSDIQGTTQGVGMRITTDANTNDNHEVSAVVPQNVIVGKNEFKFSFLQNATSNYYIAVGIVSASPVNPFASTITPLANLSGVLLMFGPSFGDSFIRVQHNDSGATPATDVTATAHVNGTYYDLVILQYGLNYGVFLNGKRLGSNYSTDIPAGGAYAIPYAVITTKENSAKPVTLLPWYGLEMYS